MVRWPHLVPYPQRSATALRSLGAPRGRLLAHELLTAQITIELSFRLAQISAHVTEMRPAVEAPLPFC